MKSMLTATVVSLLALPAAAQQMAAPSSAPVTDAVRSFAKQFARNLVLAADDMPVDKYRFKPTPQQLSVADVVVHLATSNEFMCSSASDVKAPEEPTLGPADSVAPAELKARLKRSFDFCETALAKVNDTRLGDSVPYFGGRKTTRATMLVALPYDWADHYSQMAIYLRLNGISPPNARVRAEPMKKE